MRRGFINVVATLDSCQLVSFFDTTSVSALFPSSPSLPVGRIMVITMMGMVDVMGDVLGRYVQAPIYSWFDTMIGWLHRKDTLAADCPTQTEVT